jgi:hypothetical protein
VETNTGVRSVDSCETKLWNVERERERGGGGEEEEDLDIIVEIIPT